jgi:hypothetical protein
MPRPSKFRALLGGALLVLFSAHFQAQNTFTGTWVWNGSGGWQRITLDLAANGNRLTGSISFGPGSKASTAEDWEYFFEPATFPITNGILSGNAFTFEQILPNELIPSPAGGFITRGGIRTTRQEHLKYFGQIKDNSIVITREISPKISDPFSLGNHRVSFTLRRSGSAARVGAQARVTPAPIEASAPAVSLDVEVVDAAGAPALSLTKGDFAVREDGEARPILNVIPPGSPQNVLLMFDHNLTWLKDDSRPSDRVDVSRAWDRLLQSSLSFIGRLRNQDRIAMGVFEDSTKPVLNWRAARAGAVRVFIGDVLQPPTGQKDVYGMLRSAVKQFANMSGRRSAVIFTDGRDGRLSPRWFRDPRGHEVLDPLFGLVDDGEAEEFAAVLDCVKQSGVKLHFIVINSDQDPEFGPAVVGRRISGLYPGSTEGIQGYVAGVRSRLKELAEVSGGRVLYGNTPEDALALYRDLHLELGIGKLYTLEFVSAKPADGSFRTLEASVSDKTYSLTQYRTGYIAQ